MNQDVQKNNLHNNDEGKGKQTNPAMEKYIFPPYSKLRKGYLSTKDSIQELKAITIQLHQFFLLYGISVDIIGVYKSANFTRFEIRLLKGISIKRILNLSDDIKMNLCATDINIVAPIPGKSSIGIDIVNREQSTICLCDLLESKEFREFPSNIAFVVGKDIYNKIVVADIAKMTNILIGGTTGSGKTVFIDSIIMSILYKAHPDDVKMILIDTKAVNMGIYSGIPHLLIPVVTNASKALAVIRWAIAEAENRYKIFSEYNARNLKEYNNIAYRIMDRKGSDVFCRIPQILVIIDDLSDLMAMYPSEAEYEIVNLARISRAVGIHIIISTQRPSSNVVTGLIKTNIPSRIAFKVFSNIDSRTIIGESGAEKLFGKGDMLFYPQGYTSPVRIQGAFVSNEEISDVVEFLKNQTLGNIYSPDIQENIASMGITAEDNLSVGEYDNKLDPYVVEAGKYIIEKDKASIGMLQRIFKIGFNRAARIMDELCEIGVVGEEEGTKPRKVLMNMEQFEKLLENIL